MARNVHTASARDTIAALGTPPGSGAIAIIRVSGPAALSICIDRFSRDLGSAEPGHLLLGTVSGADANPIDRALAVVWRAPNSYTGEDCVEFHLHGSPAVVDAVLTALAAGGARMAEPGEFTRRAFLNGKMDLAQAEAVAALSGAQTDAARRAALRQLGGGLSESLAYIRTELVAVAAELEASVDYPEEGIPDAVRDSVLGALDSCIVRLRVLIDSHRRGSRLAGGARVVLAGPPNAGKSSLFNAILRRERAIVTPHAGTTRDTLEAVVDLDGVPVTLVNTAGLRNEAGEIESLGIERSRAELASADLILFAVDATDSKPAIAEYDRVRDLPHILVINKTDAVSADRDSILAAIEARTETPRFLVSAKQQPGDAVDHDRIADLEIGIVEFLAGSAAPGDQIVLTSQRHADALCDAARALAGAREGIAANLSPEFVLVDLQTALSGLDAVTGASGLDEDILDQVFSRFCLGK